MTISILLCEDQTLMRQGLRTILELEPGFQVVGEAADGNEAVQRYQELTAAGKRPDVVLMDIQMPRMSGVQAAAILTTHDPEARIIMLTTFDYEDYVYDAIKAGAMGYLLKDVPANELITTILQVHAGEPSIQPRIANKLLIEFGRQGRSPRSTQPDKLSPREIEILKLISEGASNRKIAEQLSLAEGTVKNYVSTILDKLHTENRTQAALLARERKLF
ncbi:LuxR family two component transcriptional regulator [Thermosporothrix hazakensis]|jgi:DNA-binding NarL/FixJ family response regulator|uniref:LuxR family two component transcriptional regulator n=2 Tax=Thermosporothrix TaxID=768650 RepID=A0A326U4P2_THEHA|nr:response regulator transcription factor [Thermosporothrix hazakensis]PZW28002.1 LuxR family two component transcriptional regulator [Thermosporothrix hazakensis]BBH86933.1 DNA-binding response regulator [Thermosporothrix sp. COM3]GCE51224.1 DNA-binding response regulator [Thermosporothrix hazakensis]